MDSVKYNYDLIAAVITGNATNVQVNTCNHLRTKDKEFDILFQQLQHIFFIQPNNQVFPLINLKDALFKIKNTTSMN